MGDPHTHLEGYPKPLKEELGLEGPIDAAFVCHGHHIAHIIEGLRIFGASNIYIVKVQRSFTQRSQELILRFSGKSKSGEERPGNKTLS